MSLNWISWMNLFAIVCLILINIIASRKGLSGSFSSKYLIVNVLEQIGRYGCMVLMVLPIFTKGWEFGFSSVAEMLIWVCFMPLLLIIYGVLWIRKPKGGAGILYALAIIPVILFLLNGLLLCHPALMVASFVFGVCHFMIVKENIG